MPENDEPTEDPVDEFLRDLSHVMHDDALADLLGEGHTLDVPGDQAVVDMFSTWRDEIDREPVDTIADNALRGVQPPSGTTPHNTGGTMSATEDAAALRAIALPFGAIQQAQQELDAALATASSILGDIGTGIQGIQAAIQAAKQEIDGGYSMIQEVENQIEQAAQAHTQG